MKQTIRFGTFETNSSSTHSCVICSDDEYKKWRLGELLYGGWSTELESIEELRKKFEKYKDGDEKFEDWLEEECYKTLDQYLDDDDMFYTDVEEKEISGIKVHVICKYGYDG